MNDQNTVGAAGGGGAWGFLGNLVGAAGQIISAREGQRLQEQRIQAPVANPDALGANSSKLILFGGIGLVLLLIVAMFRK